ncbi:hypothetical protein JCM3770_000096 [Rhodotorula araucariae]
MAPSTTKTPQLHQGFPHAEDNTARVPEREHHPSRFNYHIRRPAYGPRRLAIKNHVVAMVGEYVGTTLFLMFALGGTNVANTPTLSVTGDTQPGQAGSIASAPNTSNLLYIAFSFGFSLLVCAWVFFRVSGGLFNPSITCGMLLVGALSPLRAALVIVAQILGGITGSAIIYALLPGTLNVRTTLGADVSIARGFWIECFMTALLMLTILLLAAEKHRGTFLAPLPIGLALFIAELVAVFYTGGSLNPARSFGPSVVLHEFEGYDWLYWLGPCLGATIAAAFYRLIKYLEYETVLGPEPGEGCNHPVLQITNSTMGSTDNLPGTTGGEGVEGRDGYAIEGTGFGDHLHSTSSEDAAHASPPSNSRGAGGVGFGAHGGQLSIAGYDERFDRLEGLVREMLATQREGLGRVDRAASTGGAGHQWRQKERKGSVAATLVEQHDLAAEKL